MWVVWAFLFSVIFLFFPIGLWCDGFYSLREKKVFWCVSAYAIFRITGGFLLFLGGKIWVYRKKELISMPLKAILKENKARYDVLKGVHVSKCNAVVEYGSQENPIKPLLLLQTVSVMLSSIFSIINTKNNTISLNKREVYLSNENAFCITVRVVFWFTPLFLGIAIIKKILNEKVQRGKRKNKQNIRNACKID